ncbi:MAG TPA: O-antigen ligase family protein [Pyrinomonadaceae bacterium]|nr:O-antigen ligase family protein [Pyrinomonadaceae bacterium]HMP66850.1 O-antigen ligase family protein [Pyrinomonadaceae bacterium]
MKVLATLDRTTRAEEETSPAGSPSAHRYTYAAVFLFTLILYFRPHEAYPGIPLLAGIAFWSAAITLLVYICSQLNYSGSLTFLSPEVKCALLLAVLGLLSVPIARDPTLAWNTFSDPFIKVMAVFIVLANVLTNEQRIRGLMWLGIGIGGYLSYQTYELYNQGVFSVEGYRVTPDFGGMFGNPNDMSIHLVMFIPISFTLALASRTFLGKLVFYVAAGIMAVAISLTQSRSGFIGLVAIVLALIWKLGRGRRVKAMLAASICTVLFLAFAPGNYGVRVLSIFDFSLDATGSASQRREALDRSILVTLRNPQGVGIGNSSLFGLRDLETHNAYTQISSELGWIALGGYVVFLVYPMRRLSKIEKEMSDTGTKTMHYYMIVGTHAAIIGYMVSSFFASVAYLWYVYYPVAFAIGLRGIYEARDSSTARGEAEQATAGQEQRARNLSKRRRYRIPR